MNFAFYVAALAAALFTKTGSFSFWAGRKYNVTIVGTEHTAPLGKFSLNQAIAIATMVKAGAGTYTIRLGADDYTLTVTPA